MNPVGPINLFKETVDPEISQFKESLKLLTVQHNFRTCVILTPCFFLNIQLIKIITKDSH